jgi:hypothetical protein
LQEFKVKIVLHHQKTLYFRSCLALVSVVFIFTKLCSLHAIYFILFNSKNQIIILLFHYRRSSFMIWENFVEHFQGYIISFSVNQWKWRIWRFNFNLCKKKKNANCKSEPCTTKTNYRKISNETCSVKGQKKKLCSRC